MATQTELQSLGECGRGNQVVTGADPGMGPAVVALSVAARQATCSLTSNLCLPGQDPEGSVNGSEVGDEIRAGVPADRAVDQFTDQFSRERPAACATRSSASAWPSAR